MPYDDFDIQLARKRGAPEPEANAVRANAVIALVNADRLDEAEAGLDEITDPVIRGDMETLIEFNRTSICMPRLSS